MCCSTRAKEMRVVCATARRAPRRCVRVSSARRAPRTPARARRRQLARQLRVEPLPHLVPERLVELAPVPGHRQRPGGDGRVPHQGLQSRAFLQQAAVQRVRGALDRGAHGQALLGVHFMQVAHIIKTAALEARAGPRERRAVPLAQGLHVQLQRGAELALVGVS